MKTVQKYFRVDRREISFLRFIFEGYDGLALVSTLDRESGLVSISMAPGCEDEVEQVIEDLTRQILIEPICSGADGLPETQV